MFIIRAIFNLRRKELVILMKALFMVESSESKVWGRGGGGGEIIIIT